jgi:hypothetical protein
LSTDNERYAVVAYKKHGHLWRESGAVSANSNQFLYTYVENKQWVVRVFFLGKYDKPITKSSAWLAKHYSTYSKSSLGTERDAVLSKCVDENWEKDNADKTWPIRQCVEKALPGEKYGIVAMRKGSGAVTTSTDKLFTATQSG